MSKVTLSASRINLLCECTWKYYCRYILKLPDEGNDGANRGTICHLIFECLLNPRHRRHFDAIIELDDVFASKAITKLIYKHAFKLNVANDENIEMIKDFILTGLKYNFFDEGSSLLLSEQQVDYENPNYKITGFIDKTAYFPDGSVKITDWKSSKAKYTKDYLNFCVQSLLYALAEYKKHGVIPKVEFVFLKFKKAPGVQAPDYTPADLQAFEDYLTYLTDYLSNFDLEKAYSNFAWKDVTRRWLCGKKCGELNKAGEPAFICSFKYSRIYFALEDESGKIIKTAYDKSDLEKLVKNGQKIVRKEYSGCPAHRFLNK